MGQSQSLEHPAPRRYCAIWTGAKLDTGTLPLAVRLLKQWFPKLEFPRNLRLEEGRADVGAARGTVPGREFSSEQSHHLQEGLKTKEVGGTTP